MTDLRELAPVTESSHGEYVYDREARIMEGIQRTQTLATEAISRALEQSRTLVHVSAFGNETAYHQALVVENME